MKHNWTYKKLTDVCGIQYGFPFDSHCFTDDSSFPPLIRIRDVMRGFSETFYNGDVPEDYYVKAGEYLIGMDGEFNIAPWRSEKALLNQRVCKIYSSDANTSIHFIYYSLIKLLKQIEAETPSVTVKHLSAKRLNQIELLMPSKDEQQAIVSELDGINHLIDRQEEQLRDYDRLAQSLFYSTFGDPATNPKGWEVKSLGDIAEPITGITYSPGDVADDGIIVLRSSNIQDNKLDFDDIVRVRKNVAEKYYVKAGDILMCSRNGSFRLVGKTALVDNLSEKMTWGAFMTIIRSDYNPYLLQYFRTPAFREQLTTAKTTTVNQITIGMLKKLQLPIPPANLQQSFAAQIEAIEQQKALIRRSLDDTRTLLAARMQYYFE